MKRSILMLLAALSLLLAACGQSPAAITPTTAGGADHSGHAMGDSSAPFDAQFIDAMIAHHQGALDMARQVLEESQRPELRTMAEAILATQEAEIDQMRAWRSEWYPDLGETAGMAQEMGAMEIADEPGKPFDQRFLEAMISHHQGAIMMAREAQAQAEHPELQELAAAIITAQEAEIAQMQQWLREWFEQ